MKDTLRTLAKEDWRIKIDDIDENEVAIFRPDIEKRGAWIGPLASVFLGMVVDDGDGGDAFSLDCQSGRNLYAVAMLPQFAGLVTWIDGELKRIMKQIGDELPDAFLRELKDRIDWLIEAVDRRDESMSEGTYNLMSYERTCRDGE